MATVHRNFYVNPAPQDLITGSPLNLTNTFSKLGEIGHVGGADTISVYLDITIGTSVSPQIKVLGGSSASDISYALPLEAPSTSKVDITTEVRQFPNSDGKRVFEVRLNKIVPFIQFFVKDSAGGSGTINSARVVVK